MKLVYVYLVWLGMATVLATGIVLAVKGSPWLLVLGFLGLVLAFAKIGCMHQSAQPISELPASGPGTDDSFFHALGLLVGARSSSVRADGLAPKMHPLDESAPLDNVGRSYGTNTSAAAMRIRRF